MPHAYSYGWNPVLLSLNVVFDILISLACFSIPVALLWFVRKRRDLAFRLVFLLFSTFVVGCGATNVLEIWNFWDVPHWLGIAIKAVTALASVATGIVLARLAPKALDLPTAKQWRQANTELHKEIHERRDLEINLRITAGRFREQSELIELIHDAILVRNLKDEIVFWNRAAERLYGWQKHEVQGRMTHQLLHTVFPENQALIEAAVIANGFWEGELQHRTRDGGIVIVSSRWASHIGEKGERLGILESDRDITESRRLEEELHDANDLLEHRVTERTLELARSNADLRNSQELLRLAHNVASIGTFDIDKKTDTAVWSSEMEEIYGLRPGQFDGRLATWRSMIHSEDLGQIDRLSEIAEAERTSTRTEFRILRPDGQIRWIASRARLLFDSSSHVIRIVGINLDITEQSNRQAEIFALNASLEQRVSERTGELIRTNNELESFSYSVSHDLRAPLRHIDGFTRILKEEFTSQLPEEGHRYLDRIIQSATHMGHLIDDLLDLSRISRKELSRQSVKMTDLVRPTVADLCLSDERKIAWQIGELPELICDSGLIRLVFINLLSNAVKFTRKCPAALIEVGSCEIDGALTIYVRDNGVGFDLKYADNLFGVFQRLHRQEDFEGTGIGLATVQRIIHRHGGKIWVEAAPDRGATFFFTLGPHSVGTARGRLKEVEHA
jgi:PAS domain S-box-containing protein